MPMTAACPHCEAKLSLPDKASGKTVKCPKCTKPFAAPVMESPPTAAKKPVTPKVIDDEPAKPSRRRSRAVDDIEDDELPRRRSRSRDVVEDDDEDFEERPRRKRKPAKGKKKTSPVLLIGIAVGVLVLIGVGVAALMWMGGDGDNLLGISGGRTPPEGWSEVGDSDINMHVFLPGNVSGNFINHSDQPGGPAQVNKNIYQTHDMNSSSKFVGLSSQLRADRTPGSKFGSSESELLEARHKYSNVGFVRGELKTVKSVPIILDGKQGLKIYLEEQPRLIGMDDPSTREFFEKQNAKEQARVEKNKLYYILYIVSNDEWFYSVSVSQNTAQPIPDDVQKTVEESFEFD